MPKTKINKETKNRKSWPEDCPWPQPLEPGYGPHWDIDLAEMAVMDEEGQDLLEIIEYMNDLVSDGRLNEDYSLNPDFDEDGDEAGEFIPSIGEDYWDENQFQSEWWQDDMTDHLNLLKLDYCSPVNDIERIIGYEFINENLLRQAFTRRAFGIEYGTGDSEKLEFIGDTVLNTVVTKEIAIHLTETAEESPSSPFFSKYSEGDLTKMRSHFISKEHLFERAVQLGLDQYILYGTGEERTESALEDMMEAVIGAVAADCEWDWTVLEEVVDRLVCIQIKNQIPLLETDIYDIFNRWHQKKFGCMPVYEVDRNSHMQNGKICYDYLCTLRFYVPDNDKDIPIRQRVDTHDSSRSKAREYAAIKAYDFVIKNGLWASLSDAGIEPKLEDSINQLQELYQKEYLEELPQYSFSQEFNGWHCTCLCSGIEGWGHAPSKTKAKKKAAFMALVKLMKAAGICRDEWENAMWKASDDPLDI